MIADVIASLEALYQSLRRGKAVNVNDQTTKQQVIALAQRYFADVRPLILQSYGEDSAVLDHDRLWQQIVRLAHGNNPRRNYQKLILDLKKELSEFSIFALTAGLTASRQTSATQLSKEEHLVLATLERLVPSAAASYRQGLDDLRGGPRLSYRGTAAEFREALRETLDHLAPDGEVAKQAGFKLEGDQKRPTTKQKVRYVLSSRGRNQTQRNTAEKSLALIEELAGEVTRAIYNQASLATHVQQSKREVDQIKRYVDTVLFDLLEISG